MEDKCILLNRYEIKRTAGEGSYSVVYEAFDREAVKKVALKKLKATDLSEDERKEAEELFFREVEILKNLTHPGIPRFYDFFYYNAHFYLVMEWVKGGDLSSIVNNKGKFTEKEILPIMDRVIEILVYLQNKARSIIFKDLKPSNLMLVDSIYVKIIDFGTARRFKPDKNKDTLSLGTPGYAPLEAYRGTTDLSSDVYSFGATFYHIITGKEPFQFRFKFPDPRTFAPELSKDLALLILDCLKDKDNRIQNAGELQKRFLQLKRKHAQETVEKYRVDQEASRKQNQENFRKNMLNLLKAVTLLLAVITFVLLFHIGNPILLLPVFFIVFLIMGVLGRK